MNLFRKKMDGGTRMYVVFVEYIIFYHRKQEYLEYMATMRQNNPNMELLESADQAGLFVEIWREISEHDFFEMQKDRIKDNHSAFTNLHQMIDHNKNRVRIWRFTKEQPNN
jgi:lipopolysaccharide export LptBFGC system permease protein LptF